MPKLAAIVRSTVSNLGVTCGFLQASLRLQSDSWPFPHFLRAVLPSKFRRFPLMRRLFVAVIPEFLIIVCFCIGLSPVSVHASAPPISSEDLAFKGDPSAPGASAVILYREVNRDDSGLRSHEDNFLRIKILTDEGRKYANIEIPFVKGQDDVVNVKARTIRPDGSPVPFDGKVFEKSIVKARGVK